MNTTPKMRLVEICPQCRRGVDSSSARLVSDVCGHTKCRICLLQEINGCLKCDSNLEKNSFAKLVPPKENAPRKSVIMSTLELMSDQPDKSTQQVIQQSLQKDILFPTDIVKRSTGNFFHLKRLISERYYNERGGKEDKNVGTDDEVGKTPSIDPSKLPDNVIYYCVVHKKSFKDAKSIEKHKNCNNKPADATLRFHCSTCNKRFKDNYALTTHQRTHTGQKCFTCPICKVELKQLYGLKRHLAAHKGERNYPCSLCNLRFITKPELNRHARLHLNLKPYCCNLCGARFTCRRALVRHESSHKQNTPLQCQQCQASFKRKDNLARHIKNSHSDQVDVEN